MEVEVGRYTKVNMTSDARVTEAIDWFKKNSLVLVVGNVYNINLTSDHTKKITIELRRQGERKWIVAKDYSGVNGARGLELCVVTFGTGQSHYSDYKSAMAYVQKQIVRRLETIQDYIWNQKKAGRGDNL